MDAYQTLLNRHTIRNFEPGYVIPKETLTKIVETVQITPSSMGGQGFDAIVVTNQTKLQEVTDATLSILPQGVRDYMNSRKETHKVKNVISCDAPAVVYIIKNAERANKDFQIDAGIAALSICVAAASFGLATMCQSICANPGTAKVLGVPDDAVIVGVAIGKQASNAQFAPRQKKNSITYIE